MKTNLVRGACLSALALYVVGNAQSTVVYAMTNDPEQNRVIAYRIGNDGSFIGLGKFNTNGRGTGIMETPLAGPNDGIDPLGSQGSLTLSPNGNFLFAVNAGSHELSVFRVRADGTLQLTDVEFTQGKYPVSVTATGDRVFVANVNDPTNQAPSTIVGFKMAGSSGELTHIPGSITMLSSPKARPSQVSFTPDGRSVVVTERETNVISLFGIKPSGALGLQQTIMSPRPAPFGMGFARKNILVVSEAAPNDPLGGSASSYRIAIGRSPIVSAAVMNFQEASCWVTIHPNGTRAYISNTGSDTVSTYAVNEDGELSVRQQGVKIPSTLGQVAPIDADINDAGSAFYQLLGATGEIAIFKVDANGDLHFGRSVPSGLSRGSQGLAVWQ